MNDEGVVEVLNGAREAVNKLIAMLEVEHGYHPVSTVHLAKHQLLVSEIGDAIRYLELERNMCPDCGNEMTMHCEVCHEH